MYSQNNRNAINRSLVKQKVTLNVAECHISGERIGRC